MIKLIKGDCLEELPKLADDSIDMVLVDLPYGVTDNYWDNIIPFEDMWQKLLPKVKERAAMVFFGIKPFSCELVLSNKKMYRHALYWDKNMDGAFMNAKVRPKQIIEELSVFGKKSPAYYPIMTKGEDRSRGIGKPRGPSTNFGECPKVINYLHPTKRYPNNYLYYSRPNTPNNPHPTFKPVSLLKYLIMLYTNKGDIVLDFTMGSGSTGVACVETERNFIGIELDNTYFETAQNRIREAGLQMRLPL